MHLNISPEFVNITILYKIGKLVDKPENYILTKVIKK